MIRVFHILASDAVGGGADEHTLLLGRDQQRLGLRVGLVAVQGPILAEARQRYGWPAFPFRRKLSRRNVRDLAALLRAEQPDVVHTHKPMADLVGLRAARRAGVPAIVATIHVRLNTERALQGRRRWRLVPLGTSRARVLRRIPHRLVAVSEATRQDALRRLGVEPERIVTVHNGTDVERYSRLEGFDREAMRRALGCPPEARLIGVAARVVRTKGHHTLLEAMPRILSACPQAHLVFAGKTDDQRYVEQLKAQAAALGVAARVHFAGLRRDVPEVLNALDLFVLPSSVEGLSRAMLEALACETPVVATATDGNREVLRDGENGRLVEPGDARSLAATVAEMLLDHAMCRRLAVEGRSTVVQQFNSREAARSQVELYRQILGGGK